MPENGVVQISHEEILTYDEITRISRCMTGLGIRKIKLTGGEPLIRKNCATLVRMLVDSDEKNASAQLKLTTLDAEALASDFVSASLQEEILETASAGIPP